MEDIIENGIYTLLLVEEKEKSYFVTLKKGKLKVYELKTLFECKKIEFEGYIYKKLYRIK